MLPGLRQSLSDVHRANRDASAFRVHGWSVRRESLTQLNREPAMTSPNTDFLVILGLSKHPLHGAPFRQTSVQCASLLALIEAAAPNRPAGTGQAGLHSPPKTALPESNTEVKHRGSLPSWQAPGPSPRRTSRLASGSLLALVSVQLPATGSRLKPSRGVAADVEIQHAQIEEPASSPPSNPSAKHLTRALVGLRP